MALESKRVGHGTRKQAKRSAGSRPGQTLAARFEPLEHRRLFASVVVNSTLDQIDSSTSSVVTLRDAIARANSANTSTAITFDPKVFTSLKTITLNGSRLVLQNASAANVISITGPTPGVIINGNHASGDFVIQTNTKAYLVGLRIVGGKSTNGAGVDNYGNVSIANCTITENSSPNGGGVYTNGTAFILNSTISNNVGTTGGGIWNGNSGYLSVTDSTIAGNTASYGGGIFNGAGTIAATAAAAHVELHNATISNNTAGYAGGVFNYASAKAGLSNTIIAGNHRTGTALSITDVGGIFTSNGFNLIGNADGSSGWITSDFKGNSAAPLNAKLNPLGNYGGPTYTMTLAAGSPALGSGSVPLISWEKYDQRGLARVVNNKVDIGAIETQSPITVLPIPTELAPGTTASPGPVLTTLTPHFTWAPVTVAGITGYQLNLYDKTSGKAFSYNISGATTSSFNLPTGVLVASDQYVWNLRVIAGSTTGAPSVYLNFQAPPETRTLPVPVITEPGTTASPGPVITTLTPTFRWQGITSGITGFQLNVYDKTSAKGFTYTISPTATSFGLPAGVLVAGDQYLWNLRVLNGTAVGAPSVYLNFQAPPATAVLPVPVVIGPGSTTSPGPVLTTLSPTFSWKAITTGITGFQLNLYDITAAKFVSFTIDPSATSFTVPTPLTAGDAYVWNLRVIAGAVTGKESAYLYFQLPPAV